MMLITTLHYYPDASNDASVEFGSLLFFFHDKELSRMAWFEAAPGAIVAAQSATDAAWMRRILMNFTAFVEGIIEELPESGNVEDFARGILRSLPVNFRHGDVSGYPDADFVLRLARSMQMPVHTHPQSVASEVFASA
jgi:hypothetical protein